LTPIGKQSGTARLALYALVAFGVVGFCLHATFTETPEPEPVTAPSEPVDPTPPRQVFAAQHSTTPAALVGTGESASAPLDPHTTRVEAPHPAHPVTPAHERLFRENQLISALNGAMDVRDAVALRRLLATYREDYPEDALGLHEGYELIASCLDRPGAETAAAARRYYETETASTLRRHVRRHCSTPERAP
jgi:hypothetical protein